MPYIYLEFDCRVGDRLRLRVVNLKVDRSGPIRAPIALRGYFHSDNYDNMLIYGAIDRSPEQIMPKDGTWIVEIGESFITHYGAQILRVSPNGTEHRADRWTKSEEKIRRRG